MCKCHRTKAFITIFAAVSVSLMLGCAGGERKELAKSTKITIKMVTSENIHDIMQPDEKNVWVCGSYGAVFHGFDNGTAWVWEPQVSGTPYLLAAGSFINSKKGWLAGLLGTILHTEDGGKTWVKQTTNTQEHLFSICFVDENNGWAAGNSNTILHTQDGGKTWQKQVETGDKILNRLYFIDKNNGWVVGETGIIYKTDDGGQTWKTVMPKSFERATQEEEYENARPTLFGIAATDPSNVWLYGIDGTILRTTDGGDTWTQCVTNTELAVYSLCIKDGKGWAIGDKGLYLMSTDGGVEWKKIEDTIKTKQWLGKNYFSSPEKGWVVGAAGSIVRTTDGGKTWGFLSGLHYDMEFFSMPKALEFKGMMFE